LFYKLPHPLAAYFFSFCFTALAACSLSVLGCCRYSASDRPWLCSDNTSYILANGFMLNRANIEGVVVIALAAGCLPVYVADGGLALP